MDYEEILKEQFNNIASQEDLNQIVKDAQSLTGGIAGRFTPDKILQSILEGESIFNNSQTIETFKDLVLVEVRSALFLCAEILTICIVIGILKGLSTSFKTKSISNISLLVCTMIIIGISITSIKETYNLALDTTGTMVVTMELLTPILIGILIATGSVTSGTILSPMIIASITFISYFVRKIVLPALFIACILELINCLTEKDYVNKLSKLIKNLSLAVTGILLVVLTGIITIQGLLTETSDGLLLNTAKYSLSNFIPIVGGFTSDTVELFLRCMTSIKSVVGIFGIIIILLLLAVPIIKILAVALIYKLTAALAEPITDSKLCASINDMSNCIISMASIMFFTSLMFVMFIATILRIGGG